MLRALEFVVLTLIQKLNGKLSLSRPQFFHLLKLQLAQMIAKSPLALKYSFLRLCQLHPQVLSGLGTQLRLYEQHDFCSSGSPLSPIIGPFFLIVQMRAMLLCGFPTRIWKSRLLEEKPGHCIKALNKEHCIMIKYL